MLKFDAIRSGTDGQRGSFEELVCQIFRRNPPADAAEYRRIHGSGGDGGIESYWGLTTGKKIDYQAKYFTKVAAIDWAQLDKSFKRAIDLYPDLQEYVFALPCNLTGRKSKDPKVNFGWKSWVKNKKAWEAYSKKKLGRAVELSLKTASDIEDLLAHPNSVGLKSYWFEEVEFSADWFKRHVHEAITALDERYHPEDHVHVRSQRLLEVFRRSPRIITEIREQIEKFDRAHRIPVSRLGDVLPPNLLGPFVEAQSKITGIQEDLRKPVWISIGIGGIANVLQEYIRAASELHDWLREKDDQTEQPKFDAYRLINRLGSAISELRKVRLKLRSLGSETSKFLMIHGRAGSGKSHLLAKAATDALAEGAPTLLFLGQQLQKSQLYSQLVERLDISSVAWDKVIGALDAAAESAQTKAFILVDAINEGAGRDLWREEIATFIERIGRYDNIVCVFACRTEYFKYLVPERIRASIPTIEIAGFETAEEQEAAAKVYLDNRGIARPSTPWLAPEFVNPLFLRSTCNALRISGKREFPKGLTGTKAIFSFYIQSVARHLTMERAGGDELIAPTYSALMAVAHEMAIQRKDYISLPDCSAAVNSAFLPFGAPKDLTWLDVLQKNGLFRLDPDPVAEGSQEVVVGDVVRFSFQRFQDHFMAEALLKDVPSISDAFSPNGALAFIFEGTRVSWRWSGLCSALSIQIPEKYAQEFSDSVSSICKNWLNDEALVSGFIESVRWRESKAFSDRTLSLYNELLRNNIEVRGFLFEFSVSVSHPWNADFLHQWLTSHSMPERDSVWTTYINAPEDFDETRVETFLAWSAQANWEKYANDVLRLVAIATCWLLTASNRNIRDMAIKCLVRIFTADKKLTAMVVGMFKGVDDIYVHEGIWAAIYGACCIDPSAQRLKSDAELALTAVFTGIPRSGILYRDYARGVAELALHKAAIDGKFDITRCRPPYGSKPVVSKVTEASVEALAAKAGDNAILRSCTGFIGDFGIYEISPKVRDFTTVKLSEPAPHSRQEIYEKFVEEVVDISDDRSAVFEELLSVDRENPTGIGSYLSRRQPTATETAAWREARGRKLNEFLALLSAAECKRFEKEAAPWFSFKREKEVRIDHSQIESYRRWVAQRAYKLGWNSKRFPSDRSDSYSRERPEVERIGKKYQWIALDELLCSLADNFWLRRSFSEGTGIYDVPMDIGFIRDIDPTVIPHSETQSSVSDRWIAGPEIDLGVVDNLLEWPFLKDPASEIPKLIRRGPTGKGWLSLYDHVARREKDEITTDYHTPAEEFRLVYSIIVPKADRNRILAHLEKRRKIDVGDWQPGEEIDGYFLGEIPWRRSYWHDLWSTNKWKLPVGAKYSKTLISYRWESHLDRSLQEGASEMLLKPWIAGVLEQSRPTNFTSDIFLSSRTIDRWASVVNEEAFRGMLDREGLDCIWLFICERNAFFGRHEGAARRRSEGLCWLEGNIFRSVSWLEDHTNNPIGLTSGTSHTSVGLKPLRKSNTGHKKRAAKAVVKRVQQSGSRPTTASRKKTKSGRKRKPGK